MPGLPWSNAPLSNIHGMLTVSAIVLLKRKVRPITAGHCRVRRDFRSQLKRESGTYSCFHVANAERRSSVMDPSYLSFRGPV